MNIMKVNKSIILFVIGVMLVGCGDNKEVEKTAEPAEKIDTSSVAAEVATGARKAYIGYSEPELKTIALMQSTLTEVMDRMKYGDKSGLYENEFRYLTDDVSFDDYLGYEQVKVAGPDSVVSLEVTGFEMRDDGSAIVDLVVHFVGPTGEETDMKDKIRMYQRDGVWFKPYVSKTSFQVDYDKIIREADSAAAAEAEGN